MRNTAYYNLNIVDGTDIVNPLTVDNPNYEQIDEVMHNNAISGVTLATEIANANVHALTRENSECAVIRFIATSNWKKGDTITVDGLQVTALLPNGETLPDAAYVINANVLCILTGTNLTVFAERERIGREILDSNFEGFDTVLEWAIANPNSIATYIKGVAPSDGPIAYGKYWCIGRDLFSSGVTVFAQANNSNVIFKRVLANGAWITEWTDDSNILKYVDIETDIRTYQPLAFTGITNLFAGKVPDITKIIACEAIASTNNVNAYAQFAILHSAAFALAYNAYTEPLTVALTIRVWYV